FPGLCGGSVTIRNGEVGEPMGRNARLMVGSGRDAANELLAVFDVPVVVGGVLVFLHDMPAEKARIEVSGAGLIGRAEVGPAERARRASDSGAGIPLALPDGKNRARGILEDGHATGITNVEGGRQDRAAKIGSASGAGFGAFHRNIEIPVRRHAALKLIG